MTARSNVLFVGTLGAVTGIVEAVVSGVPDDEPD
jgi:hypothetical protein